MNGVYLNEVQIADTPNCPLFFDIRWIISNEDLMLIMREYFLGVNMYLELQSLAGFINLMGQHQAILALNFYDIEGML